MTIEFGPDFAPTWEGRPPGISPEDLLIWRAWFPTASRLYVKFNFNVRIVQPLALRPDLEPEFRRMAELNAARRIDVLGWTAENVDIIELRAHAGLSALGHLLGYKFLLDKDQTISLETRMVLVTNAITTPVSDPMQASGVRVVVV